jgi:hypothetical protein
MRTLQLYGAGSSTANAVAQVTFPSAAKIRGVVLALCIDSVTDNADVSLELSKVPVSQIATNSAVDAFCEVKMAGNFATSGLAQAGVNKFYPLDVDVRQGEIVYLHATVTGTLAYKFTAIFNYG